MVNGLFLPFSMETEPPDPPRGRPRAFDPDDALDRAMRVFWEKGYLGASLSDLTEAMGINRPSLYATFGNKEELYRKVLDRYALGPTAYLAQSVDQPTARGVVEHRLKGVIRLLTAADSPGTCLVVHGTLSCGGRDEPLCQEFQARRLAAHAALCERFKRARAEGDLPGDADPSALAHYVQAITSGLSVMAFSGATKRELLQVVRTTLEAWGEPASPR